MEVRKEIELKVKKILLSSQFFLNEDEVDLISSHSSLINDLGLDSIQILELLVCIEKEFNFLCEPYELNLDIFDEFQKLIDFIVQKIYKNVN